MSTKLYIYTSNFPFSKSSEAFLGPEIQYAKDFFPEVTIVPVNGDSYRRTIPNDIHVDETLVHRSVWTAIRAFLGMFSIRVFKRDKKSKPQSFSELKDAIKYYYAANLVFFNLIKKIKKEHCQVVLYSYWLTYPPIAFAWIKKKFPEKKICAVSRAHGSDVYSTDVGVFLPQRALVLNKLDEIFTVSLFGCEYLKKRYGGSSPITISRLGVSDNYNSKEKDSNVISIVSCSNLIPLKRVKLLFYSLNNYAAINPEVEISWLHIGSGPLLDDMRLASTTHQPNLSIEFPGALNNQEILNIYRSKYFDCYVLLSESEGVPVSIMEALASGIPVIATNVGGVSEIVNDETGYLLNKDFSQEEFNSALNGIITTPSLRDSSYKFFKKNYEAKTNFNLFYQNILQRVQ